MKEIRDQTIIKSILDKASLEGPYVLPGLKQIAEKHCKVCFRSEIIKNHFITILQPKANKRYFEAICKYAVEVIKLITKKLGAKSLPMLDVLLIDLDLPKQVDLSKIPDSSNVNSGFSYPTDYKIVVYRHEEMLKVLIHELLHVYRFRLTPSNDKMTQIQKEFAIKFHIKGINLDEGYVDALAIIINTILYSKTHHELFENCLKREMKFILRQAKSIITQYQRLLGSQNVIEPTNTISYYVLKAMLLINGNIPIIHDNVPLQERMLRIDTLTDSILAQLKSSSMFFKNISKIRAKYDNMRMSSLNVMKGI